MSEGPRGEYQEPPTTERLFEKHDDGNPRLVIRLNERRDILRVTMSRIDRQRLKDVGQATVNMTRDEAYQLADALDKWLAEDD